MCLTTSKSVPITMPTPVREEESQSDETAGQLVPVDLSQQDVAVIIDALLQAEVTLPLIDARYRSMDKLRTIRAHQLSLANRLEDVMADVRAQLRA